MQANLYQHHHGLLFGSGAMKKAFANGVTLLWPEFDDFGLRINRELSVEDEKEAEELYEEFEVPHEDETKDD